MYEAAFGAIAQKQNVEKKELMQKEKNKGYELSCEEEKALLDFRQRLKSRCGDELISIKLFGSRARGDARPESDIDLLVVFEKYTKKVEDILIEVICDILNSRGIYFEVVSYSRQEYEKSKREQWPFVLNLEKEAVLV